MYVYLYVEYTSHNDDFHTLLIHIITVQLYIPRKTYIKKMNCCVYCIYYGRHKTHIHTFILLDA